MISPELELRDVDPRHWRNGWQLLVPPRVMNQPRWALVIIDGAIERVVKTIIAGHEARGSITPPMPLKGVSEQALQAYAKQLDVGAVIVVDKPLIRHLSKEIEGALSFTSDGAAQGLIALRALKKYAGRGVWTEPPILDILPAPTIEPLQRTFDLLVPDRSSIVAYVIDDDCSRVHTSIIAVKDGGDIVTAAGHGAIADLISENALARDWTTTYKRVISAVEERFAKPSVAIFLERGTLMKVLTGPSDTLAREYQGKRVVIDPAPAWLLGLLGGAAVAAIAGRAGRAFASMLPQSTRDIASALKNRAQTAMKESGAHPFALLGFDPLELWARLKHHYRP